MSSLNLPAEAGEVLPDAYPGAVAPSGHIGCYRPVGLLTPAMLDEAGATMLVWMIPIGVVTRDGRGREEAV